MIKASLLAIALSLGIVTAAWSQRPPVWLTPEGQAYRGTTTVPIYAGRNSIIEFRNGERIQFVQLSDPSTIVYNTNTPVESGTAHVIVLRLIRPLEFPGLITSSNPNLVVTTTQGNTYLFDLRPTFRGQQSTEANGVAVINGDGFQVQPSGQVTFNTRLGAGTVEDIERGLSLAIAKGYTPENDPIVAEVRQATALLRRGANLSELGNSPNLIAVLTSLAEMGISDVIQNPAVQIPVSPSSL